jgi:hypothetical protein
MSDASKVTVTVIVCTALLALLYLGPRFVAWTDRGCDVLSAGVYSVTEGEPGTFEYCRGA